MASIDEIIDITIVNSAQSVSRKGFGTGLFITDTVPKTFTDSLRIYSSPKNLLSDGFTATDKAYLAAVCFFGQEPKPSKLVIAPITKKDDGKTNDDWPTAITKISNVNNDWYGLATYTKVAEEILAIAKFIDTQSKVYIISTADLAVRDTTYTAETKDIASILKRSAIKNTACLYSGDANKFPECGWLGQGLAFDAGTATYAFKTISGIETDNLSVTQYQNILSKNANTYQEMAGVSITRFGTLCDGNFIDIKSGIDFISARVQESIFYLLKNNKKIPYTENGIIAIQNKINEVCDGAMDKSKQIISEYEIIMPKPSKISSEVKSTRVLEDIVIKLTMCGAIHAVKAQINYQV